MTKLNSKPLFLAIILISSLLISNIASANEDFYSKNNILYYDPNSTCGDASSSFTVTGDSNPSKIFNMFIEKGLNDIQAAGILGNIQAESGFSPTREEDSGGGGWGIVQWTGGRRSDIMNHIKSSDSSLTPYITNSSKYGGPVSPDNGYKHTQVPDDINDKLLILEVEYLHKESTTSQRASSISASRSAYHRELREKHAGKTIWDAIKSATSLKEASDIFMLGFERPAAQDASAQKKRADMGQALLESLRSSPGAEGAVTSVSSGSACSSASTNAVSNGNIIDTAKSLAWDTTKGNTGQKQEYTDAHKKYNGWSRSDPWTYTDCGVFVGTVIRMAVDPDFPTHYSPTQIQYARSKPDKYQIIENPTMENMQPGDMILWAGHSAFYGGDLGNGYNVIDASATQRVPSYNSYAAYYLKSENPIVARYIGTGKGLASS